MQENLFSVGYHPGSMGGLWI